jgi:hypothetical protein
MSDIEMINIVLSKDEALVLFEFLARFNGENHPDLFDDQAEKKALWIVEGLLEAKLAEPFLENYLEIIKEARNKH